MARPGTYLCSRLALHLDHRVDVTFIERFKAGHIATYTAPLIADEGDHLIVRLPDGRPHIIGTHQLVTKDTSQ